MSAQEATITKLHASQDGTPGDSTRQDDAGNTQEIQRDTAQYIADMILELRNMAKAAKLFKIMVPLEFAYYEAFSVANRVQVPKEEIERLDKLARMARRFEAGEEGEAV